MTTCVDDRKCAMCNLHKISILQKQYKDIMQIAHFYIKPSNLHCKNEKQNAVFKLKAEEKANKTYQNIRKSKKNLRNLQENEKARYE